MFSSSLWFPSSGTWSWEWTWCSSWWPSLSSSTSTSLPSAPRMRHSGTKDPSNLQRWPWFHLQEPDPQLCPSRHGLRHRQLPLGVHHPMHFSLIFPKPNEKLDIFGNFSRCSTLTLYLAARTLGAAASDPPAPPAPQWGPGFWRYPSPVNTEVKYTKSSERVFQHCLFIVIYSYNLLQSQ